MPIGYWKLEITNTESDEEIELNDGDKNHIAEMIKRTKIMGYESSGSGELTWRNPNIDIEEATEEITQYIEATDYSAKGISLYFSGMRLYNAEEDFAKVLEYCNGSFDIQGDDAEDRWKLVFQDGKVSKAKAVISWTEPEETDLKTALGA